VTTPPPLDVRWRAVDLAAALGQPTPTPEQAAVIEAPLAPLLVVAGAGSGKTETMAGRVLWLVANGFVAPEEVLGLTFTRKAAGELGERLASRLTALREAGLWTPPAAEDAEPLGQLPVVSTYHSYAGRIVREHGARLGVEADARLLTEAAAWQVAHEVVVAHDGPMDAVVKAESTVTTAVVDLAAEMAEHLVEVGELEAHLTQVTAALAGLVKAEGSSRRAVPAEVRAVIAQLRERRQILPLLAAYRDLKQSRDTMDFADQMAVAARLAARFPEVGADERQRFRAVLLDEFQDTSEAQLQLLRSLFAVAGEPFPVSAVGDPHQSIYGWRGASSTTLAQFRADFGGPGGALVLPLSTSWRNDRAVLAAANALAKPLRLGSPVPVVPLGARADAGRGHVTVARVETLEDEAAHVVDWLLERRRRPGRRTAAILCRKRSQFDTMVDELQRRGVAHEVVGLGGLLHTPEVADLVALLWSVQDPSRGDHLMRLLTGSRCRLGVADLDALGAWARSLAARSRPASADPGMGATGPRDLEPGLADGVSLVEALDTLPPPGWAGPDGEVLGVTARERLEGLAGVIAHLRTRTGGSLADLVAEAEAALGLDVEVLARPGWDIGAARAHLDAFAEVAATFDASADQSSLGGFLAWLDAAVAEERGLDLGWIETSPDAVQVMTVHAAKGLEWDVVAVPGLVEGSFPAHSATVSRPGADGWSHSPPTDRAWLGGLAGLPHDLRGDRSGLPRFPWDRLHDWDEAAQAHASYVAASAERGITEERRLAYVAATRARHDLLLTAHVWGTARTPRVTSRFLEEVRDGGHAERVSSWAPMPPTDPVPTNPRLADEVVIAWPPPPLPSTVDWAAAGALVRAAIPAVGEDGGQVSGGLTGGPWHAEVDLLLRERDRSGAEDDRVALPAHVSTSDLVALAADPARFALALRRPMPEPPATTSRLGTAFHAWVEQHYARAAILDTDDLPGSSDELPADGATLEELKANFLASEWALRDPLELEVPVETMVAGVSVRGRIDAVFVDPERPEGFLIVDWKSGPPATGRSAATRALQLASYRLAWSRLRGVDPTRVRGAFFHAATGETVWPDLPGLEELEGLLSLSR
jgi:DNA helicase-2/ATP-dependent DNA helicase PcrA